MRRRASHSQSFRWWLIASAVTSIVTLACGFVGGAFSPTPASSAPTATLPPTVGPPSPTPTPEGLYIGGVAVVNGTGSALRLRSDPGLQTTTLKTVIDGKRLTILEGPREADGLIWWRLRDPSDGAEGWAAQEYLAPATSP